MDLSLYTLKKTALLPRTHYMRRKESDMDGIARIMFELHYYRKPLYEFTAATMANPDILVDVDIDRDSVVLDVGAFNGDWAQKVWDRYQPTIHGFEPAPSGYQSMAKRFSGNEKVHAYEYGLGSGDSTASLALKGPGSSIYDEPGKFGSVEVRIRDVVDVLEELELGDIDLLKVNIEGGEYDLFDRLAESGWLRRMRLVLIQFHEWHPHAYQRRWKNRRALRRYHDEVWDYPWVWELWRRRGD
jgi:FkbM family methyltransferase